MEIIIGIVAGILCFVSNVIAYTLGVKHGKIVKNNGIPNMNPVKAFQKKKDERVEKIKQDKFEEGLNNILSFGEPFKEEVQ